MKNNEEQILMILSIFLNTEVVADRNDGCIYYFPTSDKNVASPVFGKMKISNSPTDFIRPNQGNAMFSDNSTHFTPNIDPTITQQLPNNDPLLTLLGLTLDPPKIQQKMKEMVSDDGKTILFRKRTSEEIVSNKVKNNIELKEKASSIEKLFILKQVLTNQRPTQKNNEANYRNFCVIIEKNALLEKGNELNTSFSQLEDIKNKLIEDIKKIITKQEEAVIDKKVNKKFTRIKANLLAFILIILIFTGAWLFTSKSGNQFGKKIMSYVPEVGIEFGGKYKPASTLPTETTSTYDPDVTINKKVYSKKEIVELIEAYQTKHNTKVWEQRRGFVFEEFANKKFSEWEAGKAVERGVNR